MKPRDAGALEELLRPRPDLVDVHAADRADDRLDRPTLRQAADGARRQRRRVQGRPPLRRDRRGLRPHLRDPARRSCRPGKYRNITGNVALAYGIVAGAQKATLPILYASYPITPASDILHELSKLKNFGVRTLQAEDEIAAAAVAIGAAFAGQLGVTATSGPGVDLKGEALGLAISLELPLVLIDVQRGGPSTGLPDQDRAVRPPARDVRPPRRVAAADRRREVAEPLLRRRVRGGAHRAEVPHAGDPAHRRLPRQRRRAVAAPGRRRAARHLGAVRRGARTTATSSGRTSATPRRSPARGRSPARPGSCTASAASRSRTAPATSTTTPPTTS